MILIDDIIGSNTEDNILAYSNQIYHSKNNKSIESIVDELYTWGCIGIIPSFNKVIKLTTSSSSSDIINTLALKDITNATNVATATTISDASKINDVLNKCSIYGKYLIENNTRAKVRVEWVINFFVLTTIRNIPYQTATNEIDYQPVLDSIALRYDSSTNSLKVIYNPKRYKLYLCNNITTSTT